MRVSTVGQLILSAKTTQKCPACGRVFQWCYNDDCYIFLPDGSVRFECPHCHKSVFRVDYDITVIEPKKSSDSH